MPPSLVSGHLPTTKLTNVSILSIALNATYFAFLIHSGKLYDIGKWSSHSILLLPGIELLKHYYVTKVLQLGGWNFGYGQEAGVSISQKPTSRYRWKWIDLVLQIGGILFVLMLSIVFFGFICLILGAPLDQYEETVSLAATLTTLTIFPIILFIGHSDTLQLLFTETFKLRNFIANSYLALLKNNFIAVILGAWGASVVAPLDWDRPWQVYPVPNIVGAVAGAFGMSVFTLLSTGYIAIRKSGENKRIV
ncbi:uncharacterized protein LOC131691868 [Topomyia yanbarensis]|uniref:uncharacterized protein LOC131691868 n=1 Tax=Topomyia yanbarensis TaxID=2498891 RepID=UPI00273CDDE6|nr:uncharacterized protein LOC131691868 [Topomyia yanbarensis]XP_058834527.1 uncharacterized protein LOC131691868 [Topomyia yanbarensis]XP_058834528.1 uncharacterized protein LOC131691868 [Topomyia yanbarensis]